VRAMTRPPRDIRCVLCDATSPGRLPFGLAEGWAVLRDVHGALHGVCADHREAVHWVSMRVSHGWTAEEG
jgi:hypothetical protein